MILASTLLSLSGVAQAIEAKPGPVFNQNAKSYDYNAHAETFAQLEAIRINRNACIEAGCQICALDSYSVVYQPDYYNAVAQATVRGYNCKR